MQRDVDLVRQILLDIERRGADCPVVALRSNLNPDADERVRHHLRLTIDAGWVKEVGCDAGSAITPPAAAANSAISVRLTDAGHEFIEFARNDERWAEAKAIVTERTGGPSLALLRAVLARWAWRDVARSVRRRRIRRAARRYYERLDPRVWMETFGVDPQVLFEEGERRTPRRRSKVYRDRFKRPVASRNDLYSDLEAELAQAPQEATLPEELL
jgi:hypothetical protein